jgi:hypothetical protein
LALDRMVAYLRDVYFPYMTHSWESRPLTICLGYALLLRYIMRLN